MYLKRFGSFGKSVVILMSGTILSQLIPFLITPLLTRLYSPSDFGIFGVYAALVSLGVIFATGRYELAILLPRRNKNAFFILQLSFLLSILFCTCLSTIVFFFGGSILKFFNYSEHGTLWLYFVPLGIFFVALSQIINYWHNRLKRYVFLAKVRVTQAFSVSVMQLVFSWLGFSFIGLIGGVLFGGVVYFLQLFRLMLVRDTYNIYKVSYLRLMYLLKRYSSFPLVDGPTALLNAFSTHLPVLLLSSMFTPKVAGFYFLTQKVLGIPITLISTSILDVFKQTLTEKYSKNEDIKPIFFKVFIFLSMISTIFSVVGYLLFDELFILFFGEEWKVAGIFAQLLIPSLALRLIASPLSFMIYVAEKQNLNLICAAILSCSVSLSLYFSKSPYDAVLFISISYCIYYASHIVIAYFLAIGKLR